jgi:transcriptional regulator with XRE-family HTH domain
MRVSPRRHVLVSLREAIGIGQKEFAGAVQIGESTLQKIELGTYPLRSRIAERIATYTGVDINYLTRNDFSEPLVNWRGEPYDKGDFEAAQGRQKSASATGLKLDYRIWDYKRMRFAVTATLLEIYHRARRAFVNQPDTWGQFHQFVHRQYRLLDEVIEAAEPKKAKTRLWERVRDDQTTHRQRLLTTKGDIDELLNLLASSEKQNQPKVKDTNPRRVQKPQPAKQRVLARRAAHAPRRARQVSSSLNSAKK